MRISFKDLLEADIYGQYDGGFNKRYEWEDFYKNHKNKTLIAQKAEYVLYRVGSSTYYLVDADDGYLGYMELTKNNEYFAISNTHSSMKGGFYDIIFGLLIEHKHDIKILSDNKLSTNAMKSYVNLHNSAKFSIALYDNGNILDFDVGVLESKSNIRVLVTAREG